MRRSFTLLAILLMTVTGFAQTLTQVWKTTDIPVGSVWGGDARQGVGLNGVYYINNAVPRAVEAYNEDGLVKKIETGYGWGITSDDAGNIICRAGTPGAGAVLYTDSIQINIIPADGSEVLKVTLEGLQNFAESRADYFGHAYGDVVNGTGYLLVTQHGETKPYAIAFDHGKVDPAKSFPLNVEDELMGFDTQSTLGFSYVDASGAQHATLMVRNGRKLQDLTLNMKDGVLEQNVSVVRDIPLDRGVDSGGEIFQLGGKLFAVYPSKDPNGSYNYLDGFEVADITNLEDIKVVASMPHTYAAEQNKGAGNWVTVEPVNETTVNIYHYYLNGYVEMCTFVVAASSELVNADFAQGVLGDINVATYERDGTPNHMQEVPGWSFGVNNIDARAGGVVAYGSGTTFGGPSYGVPAEGPEGTNGKALAVLAVWTGTVQYVQNVTLPAGKYKMTVPVFNTAGTTNFVKNLIGVKYGETEKYATALSYPVGAWTVESVEFELDEETEVTVSLGYEGANCGAGAAQHLYYDCVKLEAPAAGPEVTVNPSFFSGEEEIALSAESAVSVESASAIKVGFGEGASAVKYANYSINEYVEDEIMGVTHTEKVEIASGNLNINGFGYAEFEKELMFKLGTKYNIEIKAWDTEDLYNPDFSLKDPVATFTCDFIGAYEEEEPEGTLFGEGYYVFTTYRSPRGVLFDNTNNVSGATENISTTTAPAPAVTHTQNGTEYSIGAWDIYDPSQTDEQGHELWMSHEAAPYFIWRVIKAEDKIGGKQAYYFQNYKTGQYLGGTPAGGNSFTTILMTTEPEASFAMEPSQFKDDNQQVCWKLYSESFVKRGAFGGADWTYGGLHAQGDKLNLVTWNYDYDGSTWAIRAITEEELAYIAGGEQNDLDFTDKVVKEVKANTSNIEEGKWYAWSNPRKANNQYAAPTPFYDQGEGKKPKREAAGQTVRTVLSQNTPVSDVTKYLVRFVKSGTGEAYHIQFATGNYIKSDLTATATAEEAGLFMVYAATNSKADAAGEPYTEAGVGINITEDGVAYGSRLDGNGAGAELVTWGSSKIETPDANNVWFFEEVEMAEPTTETYTVHITGAPSETKVTYAEQEYGNDDTFDAKGFSLSQLTVPDHENYVKSVQLDGTDIYVTYTYAKKVADLSEINNEHAYVLICERGQLTTNEGALAPTAEKSYTESKSVFALVNYNENFYLWSTAEEGFVFGDKSIAAEGEFQNVVFNAQEDGTFVLYLADTEHYINIDGATTLFIDNWDTADAGNKYSIYEVETFDATDALTLLENFTTGINAVATPAAPAAIYSLTGQRQQRLQKGINIVRRQKVIK